MNSNFGSMLPPLKLIENITNKISEAKTSVNKSETRHFIQDLNITDVERKESVRIAKGDISINTFINIYRIAYIKMRLMTPTETMVLRIPSMEKTFGIRSSICIIELDISISLEKQISVFKSSEATSRIEVDTSELIFIICSHKKKLQFIQIPTRISLIMNLKGLVLSTIAKLDNKCLTAKYKTNPIKTAFATIKILVLDEPPKIFSK